MSIIRRETWKMINIEIKFQFLTSFKTNQIIRIIILRLYISYLSAYLLNKYIKYLIQILNYIILYLKYIKHFNGTIKSYHLPVNETLIKRKKLKKLGIT